MMEYTKNDSLDYMHLLFMYNCIMFAIKSQSEKKLLGVRLRTSNPKGPV